MYLDQCLKGNVHVEQVCKKLGLLTAQMPHIQDIVPFSVLGMIYNSLGKFIMQYGIILYKGSVPNIYKWKSKLFKTEYLGRLPTKVKKKKKN